MINKNLALIGILLIFVAVSYLLLSNKSSFYQRNEVSNSTVSSPNSKISKKGFSVVLKNINKEEDGGIAVFGSTNNNTKIDIRLINFSNNSIFEAQIKKGTCSDLKDSKYQLTKVVSGKSFTSLNTEFSKFLSDLPLALVIYSPNSPDNVYSCADILIK